jgi:hypothetical protein
LLAEPTVTVHACKLAHRVRPWNRLLSPIFRYQYLRDRSFDITPSSSEYYTPWTNCQGRPDEPF